MTNELKPEAFLIERMFGAGYGKPRTVLDAVTYDPRKDSFWLNAQVKADNRVTPLVAIPPTHRVVSVEMLENIAQALGKYGYFHGDIRAIIDNKGE